MTSNNSTNFQQAWWWNIPTSTVISYLFAFSQLLLVVLCCYLFASSLRMSFSVSRVQTRISASKLAVASKLGAEYARSRISSLCSVPPFHESSASMYKFWNHKSASLDHTISYKVSLHSVYQPRASVHLCETLKFFLKIKCRGTRLHLVGS